MASSKSKKDNPADRLRELLDDSYGPRVSVDHIREKYHLDETPHLDDLARVVQAVEGVNQQLMTENVFLKEETAKSKAHILKLVEENARLHDELKNTTVAEILAELGNMNMYDPANYQANINSSQNSSAPAVHNLIKTKDEEIQQNQLLINELQKKLTTEQNKNLRSRTNVKLNASGIGDTLDNIESDFNCCTKCNEEIELKIRQIENLKNQLEQITKTKDFLKNKVEDYEIREGDLIAQVKKFTDLVKHLEMEKNQSEAEKEQYRMDKLSSDKKLEEIMRDFSDKIVKEKGVVLDNVESELRALTQLNQQLEERLFKQENLIDRLTRDKVSLTNEVESYKKKCDSIDFDTHQMADKLRTKYLEALREKDVTQNELKRVRHDYDFYVKENDQDKFNLRNELNIARSRLLDVERDLISSREECIQLTEKTNKLEAEIISAKHAKQSVETARNDSQNDLIAKFEKREDQLVSGIEALQVRYVTTVKDLEELVESQKKLIDKMRSECKTLNDQLQVLALKYKNDTSYLNNQCEEMSVRLSKYEERVREFEEQNERHNELHDRMKQRLKELTLKLEEQRDSLAKVQSNEALMKSTNLQLMQELNAQRNNKMFGGGGGGYKTSGMTTSTARMNMLTQDPSSFRAGSISNINSNYINKLGLMSEMNALNTVRSIVENSIRTNK